MQCARQKGTDKTLFIKLEDSGNIVYRDLQYYLNLVCALFTLCPVGCLQANIARMGQRCFCMTTSMDICNSGEFSLPFLESVFGLLDDDSMNNLCAGMNKRERKRWRSNVVCLHAENSSSLCMVTMCKPRKPTRFPICVHLHASIGGRRRKEAHLARLGCYHMS